MKNFGDKIGDKYFKLPKYAQFIVSWIIIIGIIVTFFWLNDNYLHIPFSGGDEECSGTFEHNCGDIEDVDYRINK